MLYIIGGTPRAGKSKLAKLLLERNKIPFLSTDFLIHMIQEAQPDLRLTIPYNEISDKFCPYFTALVKHIIDTTSPYTIEGDAFLPKQIPALEKIYQIKAVFLGISQCSLETILNFVGENDWINKLSQKDKEVLPIQLMESSKNIEDQCREYNQFYIDMSIGDYQSNLESAYQYIMS
ncbi:MAG: hypothetical protein HY817_05000 [Candidatus Abawacabacteria bacterium]|nr:hypothetical protein [Candidatus Abawacabacteria bacterium]